MSFLQDLIETRRAFSKIKVYSAAVAACHIGFGNLTASQHPPICFMKAARRLLPVSRSLVLPWHLVVVLEELKGLPFELLREPDLRFVSLKAVLLLALVSISDIHALSVQPSCLKFFPGEARIGLRPNLAFVPMVMGSCSRTDLASFSAVSEELQSDVLCPVRAVCPYMDRTTGFRITNQLFFFRASPHKGKRHKAAPHPGDSGDCFSLFLSWSAATSEVSCSLHPRFGCIMGFLQGR